MSYIYKHFSKKASIGFTGPLKRLTEQNRLKSVLLDVSLVLF